MSPERRLAAVYGEWHVEPRLFHDQRAMLRWLEDRYAVEVFCRDLGERLWQLEHPKPWTSGDIARFPWPFTPRKPRPEEHG